LCVNSPRCLDEALKRRAFARALRAPGIDALGRISFEPVQPNVRDLSAVGGRPRDDDLLVETTTKG
jgi:hypothetical protein